MTHHFEDLFHSASQIYNAFYFSSRGGNRDRNGYGDRGYGGGERGYGGGERGYRGGGGDRGGRRGI